MSVRGTGVAYLTGVMEVGFGFWWITLIRNEVKVIRSYAYAQIVFLDSPSDGMEGKAADQEEEGRLGDFYLCVCVCACAGKTTHIYVI